MFLLNKLKPTRHNIAWGACCGAIGIFVGALAVTSPGTLHDIASTQFRKLTGRSATEEINAQREEISRLEGRISERDRTIYLLTAQISSRDEEVTRLNERIKHMVSIEELAYTRRELQEIKEKLISANSLPQTRYVGRGETMFSNGLRCSLYSSFGSGVNIRATVTCGNQTIQIADGRPTPFVYDGSVYTIFYIDSEDTLVLDRGDK